MNKVHAERIRFGILSARRLIRPDRLTIWQNRLLDGMNWDGLMVGDFGTTKAHDREYAKQWHDDNPDECPACNPHICDDYCQFCEEP